MTLLINNDVQERVIDMTEVVPAIEDAFTQLGEGNAASKPRRPEIASPTAMAHHGMEEGEGIWLWATLRGATRDPPRFALRFRSDLPYIVESGESKTREKFTVEEGKWLGIVLLFDTRNGELMAIFNDGRLQHARVGATAGVAAKHLSREDADVAAILGSGGMAEAYAESFDVVRDLDRIQVYSPTPEHREEFAAELNPRLDAEVVSVESDDAAVEDAAIVATCTDSQRPTLDPDWIQDGRFFVNVSRKEIPPVYEEEIENIYTTTNEGASTEVIGGPHILDYLRPDTADERGDKEEGTWGPNIPTEYPTLPEVLVGDAPSRGAEDGPVLYVNRSDGVQFPPIANHLYEGASERGLGMELPLGWFLQEYRT